MFAAVLVFMEMEEWQAVVAGFPKFTGVDPVPWIAQAHKIFQAHSLQEQENMQLLSLAWRG